MTGGRLREHVRPGGRVRSRGRDGMEGSNGMVRELVDTSVDLRPEPCGATGVHVGYFQKIGC